jgi:hypothetical protein
LFWAPAQAEEIQALTGTFNLDPNRVLGVVIDAYEYQPYNKAYARLLEALFRPSAITQILGFRFLPPLVDMHQPTLSLHKVAAYLIKVGTSACS